MKKLPPIFLALFFLYSCCDKEEINPPFLVDCTTLEEGLLDNNTELIRPIIDSILVQYLSMPTTEDQFGHLENLNKVFNQINTTCSNLEFSMSCYACLDSNPSQTPVEITIDSIGVIVARSILIYTPANDYMYLHY